MGYEIYYIRCIETIRERERERERERVLVVEIIV